MSQVLLLTPPFTQLNTPYPATAYLKGFLNTQKTPSAQVDLGIRVMDRLFTAKGLTQLFAVVDKNKLVTENARRIYYLRAEYVSCIHRVRQFLKVPTIIEAQNICEGQLLPEASRFNQLQDEALAFGSMGLLDKAKHYCTLLLEDLADFIVETVDENFGFSRYAERLGRSASSFDALYAYLQQLPSFIEWLLIEELSAAIDKHKPQLVLITIPFPGNLMGALRIGQYLKREHPHIKVSMGGGYVNTELRSLRDARIFEFCDFITLDDGEQPIACILDYMRGGRLLSDLKRTFVCRNEEVELMDGAPEADVAQNALGVPDYSDVEWDKYLSVLEVANPMFRLWSDGHWLKLTLAHGCYWGKCTFCDGSLDYIGRYAPSSINTTVDRMEALVAQTGKTGFHFVDEAAPPVLLKELALEILRRGLKVVWWTNIRFEKNFTADLCLLLRQSGCVAVAGGVEVASDRLLKLINKGVSIGQLSNVAANFSNAGIMVHTYLMYGFPSQTAQETIDSLEVVRQLFELGIVHSGFWHQFALTAHSPVGLQPESFGVTVSGGLNGAFANNDLEFVDQRGTCHEPFGPGLKKAIFNYMHGLGFDMPLHSWFDFKVPSTTHSPHSIEQELNDAISIRPDNRLVWLAKPPLIEHFVKRKAKKDVRMATLLIMGPKVQAEIKMKERLALWLKGVLTQISVDSSQLMRLDAFQEAYEAHQLGDFNKFINSYTFSQLKQAGLLII
ncbi:MULTISPECIES: B12-binding domain-containing radical SAM protein [unclassified Carboxylicivirga]|uniref:B12-binding domain-containing radical SAM protein n=1 Tax=Carboxylicivirga TaxID=1628153 RepID=UPI003D33969D